MTVKLVAGTPPKFTTVAPVKLIPVRVTVVPPATGPVDGVIDVKTGAPAVPVSEILRLTEPEVAVPERAPLCVGVAVTVTSPVLLVEPTLDEKLSPVPVKVTVAPGTGVPLESVTCTTIGLGKAVPTRELCPPPLTIVTCAAGPAIFSVKVPLDPA